MTKMKEICKKYQLLGVRKINRKYSRYNLPKIPGKWFESLARLSGLG